MSNKRRALLQTGFALTAGLLAQGQSAAQGVSGTGSTDGATHGTSAAGSNEATRAGTAATNAPSTAAYGAANLGLGVTKQLGEFLAGFKYEDVSAAALHEAKRAVLDWMGCALAGSQHPTPQILISTFKQMGSFAAATVFGQKGGLKLSLLDAAVANGQMGHVRHAAPDNGR